MTPFASAVSAPAESPPLGPASRVPPSLIRAIAEVADRTPGTLRLFYGEDTLPTPDFIKDAARRGLDDGLTFYTPNAGYPAVRGAIAARYQALHGVPVDPSEIVVTASGMVSIVLAFQATLAPGDSALVVTPLWPNIAAAVRVIGAEPIEVPLKFAETGYTLDLDALESAVRPDTKVLALASPGNPTGWTATAEDWAALAAFCERHDLWLVADGVYERLVDSRFGAVAPSPLSAPGARARTIVAQSFSKAYRMTGWRVGYALAPPPLARTLANLQEFVVSHAAGFSQEAARVATVEGEPFVAAGRARYAKHRTIAVDRLRAIPGVTVPSPSGAFYVFPRLDGLADSFGFCEKLVTERQVGVAPGSAFGEGGEGHVRICFAVDEPTLIDALDRFESGWLALRETLAPRVT